MSLLFVLSALALALWLYLGLFRGSFWRCDQRLVRSGQNLPAWPSVAVVIPARNEAAVIDRALTSHMATAYDGALSIIVVDDHSDDGTADIVRALAASSKRDIQLTMAPSLEPGWTGKLWALQHGVGAAAQTNADYFLFTDADIVCEPHILSELVAKAETENLSLVSLMALLDARGYWAGLLIPAFVFFFQKLYPFPWANNPTRKLAAAAGGCVLVRQDDLASAGGLASIGDQLIDDCALARLIKGATPQRKIWLGLTHDVQSLRDNRKLADIWHMVARTAFTQLGYSSVKLAGTLFGMTLLYVVPPLVALTWPFHQQGLAATLALGAWLVMSGVFIPTLRLYRRSRFLALALPLAGLLYGLMTFASAVRTWRGRGGQWKGRHYQSLVSKRG